MRFAKYHGLGNDFIMIADLDDRLELDRTLVRRLCDRRLGIGGDGLIRVAPGRNGATFFMDYVNSDGSVGEMCGNGIRCLALFARAEGMFDGDRLTVDTRAGLKVLDIRGDSVTVDMGPPIFVPDRIPVKWQGSNALDAKIELQSGTVSVACLSMGNPHAVMFVDDPDAAPVATMGPLIERHNAFPHGTNVEFAVVESPGLVRMRVWERGPGETLACGTGACAVAVAARSLRGTNEQVTIVTPGGELSIEWRGSVDDEEPVLMTGPALEAFSGEVDLDRLG